MKIAIVGTGYVGLVSGTCFAEMGNDVICVDIDNAKVEKMKKGEIPIYEPRLNNLFLRNIEQKRLDFTCDLASAVKESEVIFLALPTPASEDGSADLQYVLSVSEQIGEIIDDYKVIVNKSTVPVGTGEKVKAAIYKNAKTSFDVVSNPEFLREGFAVDDFLKPERVVLGIESERAEKVMRKLYNPFVKQGNPIFVMDIKSAELTKYAANSFLAMKITFMNEIANFCEKVGADVDKVRIAIASDSRIGKRFLFPGIGYGGSCFPKDVRALVKSGKEQNFDFSILSSVISANEKQKTILIPKIKSYFKDNLRGKKIAIWGLSFKPETDDIREAPSVYIIEDLLNCGAEIAAYDPEAMSNVKMILKDKITYSKTAFEAVKDADALVICTEWSEFRNVDLKKVKELLKGKVIFDGRNIFDTKEIKEYKFDYFSIGR